MTYDQLAAYYSPSLEGAKMKDTLAFVALSLAVVFFTVALFLELSK